MKMSGVGCALAFLLLIGGVFSAETPASLNWGQLPPLPDADGFAGMFGGVGHDSLLVAGGANFPDRKPWEGGRKVWHDRVFALSASDGQWRVAGRLPRPLGYGVSVTADDSILCFGGSDAERHHADGFRLSWMNGQLEVSPLPALPTPCANMTWARIDRILYVVGGIESPGANGCLRTMWALHLDRLSEGWRELEPCPGPARMLAVSAVVENELLVFGGAGLSEAADGRPRRTYLQDAWRYSPAKRSWRRLANMPRPVVAAPSPAPVLDGCVYLLTGDDGSLVEFQPPEKHPGFPRQAMVYGVTENRWRPTVSVPFSRATAPTVFWKEGWVIASGEIRPGVRTPEMWILKTGPGKVRAPQ